MKRVSFQDMAAAAGAEVYSGTPPRVTGVCALSSGVSKGDVFVAIEGRNTDGHHHITEALSRGASALITQRRVSAVPVCCALADDTKKAAGLAADFFFGHPSRSFKLVGVTGTNGKTTLCHLLDSIWRFSGGVSGMVGTVEIKCGSFHRDAVMTTPDAIELQNIFFRMRGEGAQAVCMEVSSHAIGEKRVWGCDFDAAVFTNLTPEHLDYHGGMGQYAATKKKLFTELLSPGGFCVINIDDPVGAEIAEEVSGEAVCYSVLREDADVFASSGRMSARGMHADLRTPWGRISADSNLIGQYNLSNLAAAATTALCLGARPGDVAAALSSPVFVPGRMERVGGTGCSIDVFVDYAHTEDALESALAAVRPLCSGRVFVVFGCGGDRDRSKRPLMGHAASRGADVVVVTSDNPRNEDPAEIMGDIEQGMDASVKIQDRREAIGHAISSASPGDLVLIAGKGHETTQVVGDDRLPFDDRLVAAEFLKLRGEPV